MHVRLSYVPLRKIPHNTVWTLQPPHFEVCSRSYPPCGGDALLSQRSRPSSPHRLLNPRTTRPPSPGRPANCATPATWYAPLGGVCDRHRARCGTGVVVGEREQGVRKFIGSVGRVSGDHRINQVKPATLKVCLETMIGPYSVHSSPSRLF